MNLVQAYISNNSFPTSIDELWRMASRYDMEDLLGVMLPEERDDDLYCCTSWTAPTWCKKGDIVFYMHSKTAISKITMLQSELDRIKDEIDEEKYWYLYNCLLRARSIWNAYGGKIFAIGCVAGGPEYYKSEENVPKHWKSNIYAPIKSIFALESPIDASEFKSVLPVSQTGGITPVYGSDFEYLRRLILKKNKHVRSYFIDAIPQPIPLAKMTDENWLDVSMQFRRDFSSIIQFRRYFVNYFLGSIGDLKGIHTDCICKENNRIIAYIDNVIRFRKKYLRVMSTLSIQHRRKLFDTLHRYLKGDELCGSNRAFDLNKTWQKVVLVIDTEAIYLFSGEDDALYRVFDLDAIKCHDDIRITGNTLFHCLTTIQSINQENLAKITPDMVNNTNDDEDFEDFDFEDIDEDFDWDELEYVEDDVEDSDNHVH